MNDYVKIQEIFSDFFVENIIPQLGKLENKRITALVAYLLPLFFGLPIVILVLGVHFFVAISTFVNSVGKFHLFIVCMFILVFGSSFISSFIKDRSNLDKAVKKTFLPDICKALQSVLQLTWQKSTEKFEYFDEILKSHKILKIDKNVFETDDEFVGEFHDISFAIHEISNKKSLYNFAQFFGMLGESGIWLVWSCVFGGFAGLILKHFVSFIIPETLVPEKYLLVICSFITISTIYYFIYIRRVSFKLGYGLLDNFKGLLVEFIIKKKTNGHTVVIQNDEENAFLKIVLNSEYQKVQLEDVEFNKKFSVYSTNQIEARYILTTAMMDRLMNLQQNFRSKYIRASFKDDKLVLAIQADKDMFRLASVWKKTTDKMYQAMFLELLSVLKITDALNLNSDTGL